MIAILGNDKPVIQVLALKALVYFFSLIQVAKIVTEKKALKMKKQQHLYTILQGYRFSYKAKQSLNY